MPVRTELSYHWGRKDLHLVVENMAWRLSFREALYASPMAITSRGYSL